MTVKTFRGSDPSSLIAHVKDQCGEDVEIVQTKQLGPHVVEMTVSLGSIDNRIMSSAPSTVSSRMSTSSQAREFQELLSRQGVHPAHISRLIASDANTEVSVDRYAANCLARVMHFDTAMPGDRRVVALVGATGVGKTTTIAKLAANLKLAFNLEVGLISADTFRVGAVDHLRMYAELIGVPFVAAEADCSLEQAIYRAVRKIGQMELVLVDTSGYNPRESDRVRDSGRALSSLEWCEKILLLPASSNDVDLRGAARAFSTFHCSRVILTKTDETGFIGPAVNTLLSLAKPVAFFTSGQKVPEDIEPASPARLGWMMTRTFH